VAKLGPESGRQETATGLDKEKEMTLIQLLLIEASKRTEEQKAELDALVKEKKAGVEKRYGGDVDMAKSRGVRVADCPIGQKYCYPSCYWLKGDRGCFRSQRGRQIPGLKKEKR
jgi:hypothetical protein